MAQGFLFLCQFLHLCVSSSTDPVSKPAPPTYFPPVNSKFPAVLVLGDSTVDTGNNNFIGTLFRSNHVPYGQDFDGHSPTGRFSNGRLAVDFLISELGIKPLSPPFLDPNLSDDEVCTGVNFASAGSGFDDLTTTVSGANPVSKQIEMFKSYVARLNGIVGEIEGSAIVNNALIMISAGTNDLIYNFYDIPTRRLQYDMGEYQDILLQKIQDLIKDLMSGMQIVLSIPAQNKYLHLHVVLSGMNEQTNITSLQPTNTTTVASGMGKHDLFYSMKLYDLGGRKFAISGLAPIGCIPLQITAAESTNNRSSADRQCIDEQNSDASVYNVKLQQLLPQIQLSLPGARIAYGNMYDPVMDMLNQPQIYGFEETKRGCCGQGLVEAGPLCNSKTPVCEDASKYMFFDAVHPSETVYKVMAKYILDNVLPQLY